MERDQASTILVVEDDASIQDLLQELLADEGYRVLQAADGAHGLHLAAADRPNVILLDMGLHPSSGADVLVQLRDDPTTRSIPVVALTGRPLPVDGRPHGFDGWIEKPFDLDVLLEHVGRLAERLDLTAASLTTANGRG
jgi:two-component system chemotaxis response regulator CheY